MSAVTEDRPRVSAGRSADTALRMVREEKLLVYDVETSGLDWKRNYPIGYVIGSSPADVVYVPVRHGGGGNLPDPGGTSHVLATPTSKYEPHEFERDLAKAFASRRGKPGWRVVGHHLKFDCHFSANVGVFLGRDLSCIQNNEALLNEYSRSFSLAAVAQAHGVSAKKTDELYKHIAELFGCPANKTAMQHYWELPGNDPAAVDYAIGDGVSTLEVFLRQEAEIQGQNLNQIWQIENELIWTLFRMERRGIRVDVDYLEELLARIDRRVLKAYEAFPPGFNPRSPNAVKAYVEQFATDWPTTDKGNPSFTEKWLKTFPEGKHVIAVRKWTNLANSFARPLVESHAFKGRVHANLNQLKADDYGTVSGRLSCSLPNLQQVPKHDKELAVLFRRCFLADEGYQLAEGDYSQCEPRLFTHYSAEPRLVEGYNADPPADMHDVVAKMFEVDRGTVAKRMNMGILTGMQPRTFSGHMGLPLEEATALWNRWFELFPGIRDFQNKAKLILLSRGHVRTILGRRCRLEDRRYAYRAVSKIIQGGNADIIKYKMLEVDKELEAQGDIAHLLMSVHDSFLWQSPSSPVGGQINEWIRETLVRVQDEPIGLRVPFVLDYDLGADWAEASFGAAKTREIERAADL